jgi:hypothetical protein
MKDRQIREIINSYGADPARWPKAEAAGNDETPIKLKSSGSDLAEARMVDKALDSLAHPVPASQALRARILSIPARTPQESQKKAKWRNLNWWPFGNILGGPVPQVSGLVFACVLGMFMGYSDFLATPWSTTNLTEIALGLDTPQGLISLEGAIGK